jgi:hypothetical protein
MRARWRSRLSEPVLNRNSNRNFILPSSSLTEKCFSSTMMSCILQDVVELEGGLATSGTGFYQNHNMYAVYFLETSYFHNLIGTSIASL